MANYDFYGVDEHGFQRLKLMNWPYYYLNFVYYKNLGIETVFCNYVATLPFDFSVEILWVLVELTPKIWLTQLFQVHWTKESRDLLIRKPTNFFNGLQFLHED